ncbi:basic leucine zipper nuclear factor 1 [Trichuris trichiura]|uniref:Basic leucine zipper nuclear factor 1 n=1 Tax=Trichuris trichiura TaxID=36087 RepID=A0A077YXX7_TRITR|nr:basic leucine zipper nuclear factor 1 [Trichuris trichiura]
MDGRVPAPLFLDQPPDLAKYHARIPYEYGKEGESKNSVISELEKPLEQIDSTIPDKEQQLACSSSTPCVETGVDVEQLEEKVKGLEESRNRLLVDNDSLTRQLEYQQKVNSELKKFLISSMGSDLQLKLGCLAEEKVRLTEDMARYSEQLEHAHENWEKLAIQCEVWKSKFLASCVIVDQLTTSRMCLQNQCQKAQDVVVSLLEEHSDYFDSLHQTFRLLKDLNKLRNPEMCLTRDHGSTFSLDTLIADCRTMADALCLSLSSCSTLDEGDSVQRSYTNTEKLALKVAQDDIQMFDSDFAALLSAIGGQHDYAGCLNGDQSLKSCNRCKGSLKLV